MMHPKKTGNLFKIAVEFSNGEMVYNYLLGFIRNSFPALTINIKMKL